nr:TIGR00341 family protein [Halorubellus sp. JP-L1]
MVPAGKRQTILDVLDDEGIDYAVTDETSGREYTAIVSFPLPTEAVEPVLQSLRDAGIERKSFTIVLNAETVVSQKFEKLKEQYAEDEESTGDRIAREELTARARDLAPAFSTYVLMTIVSVVIATAGILMDSPEVVVGSMVIAPLIGPAMTTAAGTVVDDEPMFRRGLKLQILGFAIAIAAAAGFAWLVKSVNFVPPGLDPTTIDQVSSRLSPDFLSLAVALGAGIAGAVSLRSGVSASLVGVMIAVALVPPTAVIGIGIAWGLPVVVLGASILVTVNVLSINLAAMSTLWYSGYRPDNWLRRDEARSATLSRIGVLFAAIVLISVFLGGTTYVSYTTSLTESTVCEDINGVLDDEAYEEIRLVSVQSVESGRSLAVFRNPAPEHLVVSVAVDPGETYPTLASDIYEELSSDMASTTIEVRFVETEYAPLGVTTPPNPGSTGTLGCTG